MQTTDLHDQECMFIFIKPLLDYPSLSVRLLSHKFVKSVSCTFLFTFPLSLCFPCCWQHPLHRRKKALHHRHQWHLLLGVPIWALQCPRRLTLNSSPKQAARLGLRSLLHLARCSPRHSFPSTWLVLSPPNHRHLQVASPNRWVMPPIHQPAALLEVRSHRLQLMASCPVLDLSRIWDPRWLNCFCVNFELENEQSQFVA